MKFTNKISSLAVSTIMLFAFSSAPLQSTELQPYEMKWVENYFKTLNQDTTIEEFASFLVSLKVYLNARGINIASSEDFGEKVRTFLSKHGIDLTDMFFEEINREVAKQELALANGPKIQPVIEGQTALDSTKDAEEVQAAAEEPVALDDAKDAEEPVALDDSKDAEEVQASSEEPIALDNAEEPVALGASQDEESAQTALDTSDKQESLEMVN